MSHHESPDAAPQAVSRWGLYLPTALLLILAAGWSGFWFYATKLADQRLAQWMAAEKAAGRHFECIGQEIGGFPFRIELTCASARLTTPNLRAELGAIHTATQIYNPKLALADISGPLRIESAGVATSVNWKDMRISVRFGQGLERLSITASDLKAGDSPTGTTLTTKLMELHMRTDTAQPAEDRAADFVVRFMEGQLASLDPFFGNQESGSLEISGTATKVLGLRAGAWQNMLEAWRSENGRFILEAGRIGKGSFLLEGKGVLDLDSTHRLRGDLNVSVKGASPLVSRLVPVNAALLAGALLERKDGAPVQLPLRLQDGRLSLGPVRTGPILAPLY